MGTEILKGIRVLIVDDEPDIIETLTDSLDMCLVDASGDFESARRFLGRKKYDAAILDVMGVNGYELLNIAVANGIPALILTAHALSAHHFKTFVGAGAYAYLPKDVMADVPEYLADLVRSHRAAAKKSGRWFSRLQPFFDRRFGPEWRESDEPFWRDFEDMFQFPREELDKML